ncbi:MAG: hypothetical protein AAF490_06330 [Chloroflexota bacterium]
MWNELAQIAPGGPILDIFLTEKGEQILVSPNGLLKHQSQTWRLLMRGVPFWQTNCAAAAGKTIFSSGFPTGIIRSIDGGKSWLNTFIDQQTAPIVNIVASPNYAKDRIMLAATDGDGILRSTDGGRHWQLSNFGLRDFQIVELVVAPQWDERYEFCIAVSETAVYQSPNGGRAWRRVEFDEEAHPSAVVFSPDFQNDRTVYLSTQDGKLFCSANSGRQWQKVADGFETISGLCLIQNKLFIVEFDKVIACATSDFSKREIVLQDTLPILSLNAIKTQLHLTTIDGVTVSADNGRSWQAVESYNARRFVWVKRSANALIVAGPDDGIWLSTDGGRSWSLLWADGTVLALDVSHEQIFVSSDIGLFVSPDLGKSWLQAGVIDEQMMGVAIADSHLWLGSQFGQIFRQSGAGLEPQNAPFTGKALLDMQQINGFVTTVVYNADSSEIQLWQWQPENKVWHLFFSERSQPNKPVIAVDNRWGVVIGVAGSLYVKAQSGWRRVQVSSSDAPITAVYSQQDHFLIGATDRLLKVSKTDFAQIEALSWDGDPILDISEHVMVTINGRVFQAPSQ